ncbi:hypothetical protein [Hymenobacter mucosus]|uniref:HEAT repeat-containing protein n=1 Tax=Hymenobacter mucosus TaxID=1411120 RepID=A0A238XPD8_9BACT|nr:hypothetical protein [Hymenobacter mucosus]SNR60194.1 hypothetical protein SAMN06269173_104238 [Hymenobacter mucosus]
MKKYFLALLVGLCSQITPAAAQIKSSEVEIWGLPTGLTRESFVAALNEKKATVCMAAIRPMGYKDAQVIWLADDQWLVTLRSDTGKPYRTTAAPAPSVVAQLNAAMHIQQLHNPEFQMARKMLFAVRAQDTAAVAAIRRKYPRHQAARYAASLRLLQAPNPLTVAQCVAVLHSAAPDSVREKALVQAGSRARTATEVYQLLPFLRDPNLGIATLQLVQGFFRYHPIALQDWPQVLPDYVQALNAPDPTMVAGLSAFLYEHKVPRQYAQQLMTQGSTTIREILQGQHAELSVLKQPLYPLLSYLAGSSITSASAGLAYVATFTTQ